MYFWFGRSSQVELRSCSDTSPCRKECEWRSDVGNITHGDKLLFANPASNLFRRIRHGLRFSGQESHFCILVSNLETLFRATPVADLCKRQRRYALGRSRRWECAHIPRRSSCSGDAFLPQLSHPPRTKAHPTHRRTDDRSYERSTSHWRPDA